MTDEESNKIGKSRGSNDNTPLNNAPGKNNDSTGEIELSNAWFQQARRATQVPEKKQVTLRIDVDILDFFKQQGRRYQTKMHAVLRAYVEGNKTLDGR